MREMSEDDWRAREDAHALAQAKEVEMDPARLKRAKDAAREMLSEDESRLNGLRKVVGKRPIQGGIPGGTQVNAGVQPLAPRTSPPPSTLGVGKYSPFKRIV